MKYGLTRGLSRFLIAATIVLSAADAVILLLSPWWLRITFEKGYGELGVLLGSPYSPSHPGGNYYFMLAFVISCGMLILGILFEAFRVLSTLIRDEPFSKRNGVSFRNASVFSFLIAFLFLVKIIFLPSILTFVCLGVFFLLGFFLIVMSQLFRIAAQIKEENELTI